MKAAADKAGISFVGGFVTDEGQKFYQTNMNEEETKRRLPDELK